MNKPGRAKSRLFPSGCIRLSTREHAPISSCRAPVTSSGKNCPHGESTQHGTSQATPVTAGLILLMQDFYQRATGELPEVDDVVKWLRRGGVTIRDGDDEDDNVGHTGKSFICADALSGLDAVRRHLHRELLRQSMEEG